MALSRGTNPLMDNTGMEGIPLRTSPWNPAGGGGDGNFAGALSAMEQFGQKAYQASMPDFGTPAAPRPVKAFNPASGKLFVNGFTFDVDDAQRALESEQYLGAEPQALPAGDWIPLDDASYSAYLEGIRNPSPGRLAAKNFGRGVDISQLLAGRALQFAGAEGMGGRIAEAQMEDLRKTSPYERMFTDIGSEPNRGVLDWFVANLAQQGPNVVESAVTALIGAGAGAAAGGGPNPFSAAGGALAALAGRQSVKQSMLAAAKKYSRGETLDAAETKMLHEQAGILAAAKIKQGTLYSSPQGLMNASQFGQYAGAQTASRAGLQQAKVGGAAIASGLQNYATGVADIYGEGIESGNPDRAYAALAGIPYGAAETLPEFLLAGKIFGNMGSPKGLSTGTKVTKTLPGGVQTVEVAPRRGLELLGSAGAGFVQGGLTEGATEAFQEGLLFGANEEVDWNSPEGINRLVNSFAAGFGVGGPIGAGANVYNKLQQNKPANLLDPAATTEPPATETPLVPTEPAPTPGAAPLALGYSPRQIEQGQQGVLDIFGYMPEGEYQQRAVPMQYGIEEQPQAGLQLPPDQMGGQQQEMQYGAPDLAQGQQGVLDIFGPASQAELDQRMQPMQYGAEEVPTEGMQPQVLPGQGALQFAAPAPEGMQFTNQPAPPQTAIGQQMYALQQQQQLQQEFEAAQQQRQLELDAQREADFNRMEAQRQLQLAQQPEVVATPTPKGQPLKKSKGRKPPAPKGEKLRVGKGGQMEAFGKQKLVPVAPEPEAPAAAGPAPKQLQLFTRTGKPTKEAAKGGKLKKGKKNVQERVAEAVPPTQPTGTGENVGGTNAGAGTTARKALPLRKGKARQKKFPLQKKQTVSVKEKGAQLQRPKDEGRPLAPVVVDDKLARNKWFAKAPDSPTTPNWSVLPDNLKEKWKAAIAAGQTVDQDGRDVAEGIIREYRDYVDLQAADLWGEMMDDGSESFTKFYDLPESLRSQWTTAVYRNKATVELGDKILSTAAMQSGATKISDMEVLEEAIKSAKTAKTSPNFSMFIETVLYHAFFESERNNFRDGVVDRALEFLRTYEFPGRFAQIAKEIFTGLSSEYESLEVSYKSGKQAGELKPWYVFAVKNDLLRFITRKNPDITLTNIGEAEAAARLADKSITLVNLPKSLVKVFEKQQKKLDDEAAAEALKKQQAAASTAPLSTPQEMVGQAIDKMFSEFYSIPFGSERKKQNVVDRLTDLYSLVNEDDRDYVVRGYPLRDYFRDNGTPKMRWGSFRDGARYIIGTDDITDVQAKDIYARQMKLVQEANKLAREEANLERINEILRSGAKGKPKAAQDEGNFRRTDGTPIKGALAPGKIRMLVSSILSKFKMTPKVFYYTSIADLKAKNPTLYKAAKAAYKGDFDAAVAHGYSFNAAKDPTVILFTDYLPTEETVRFVVAHEVLGHFGFRSVMPIADLNKILNKIYESDPDVQVVVDAEMELNGTSKLEAIEEYLADNAADVDASVLLQIWNALKNALNKIGFTFKDDAARYLIGQARKYVRSGEGSVVSPSQMANDMNSMASDGRFASVHGIGEAGSRMFGSSGMVNLNSLNGKGGLSGVAQWFSDGLFGTKANTPGNVSRILNRIQTLDNKARRSFGLSQIFRMLEQQQGYARKLLAKYQRLTDFSHSVAVTEEDKLAAGSLLADAALLRGKQMTDEVIRGSKRIVQVSSDGTPYIDQAALNEVAKKGFVTAAEFRAGFTVDYDAGPQKIAPRAIDENSNAWKVYLEYREAVNEAAIDVMLSNFMAAQDESNRILTDLNYGRENNKTLTDEDIEAIRMVGEMYKTMRYENAKVANASVNVDSTSARASEDFRVAFGLALFNDEAFKVWMKDPASDVDAANKMAKGNVADFAKYQDPMYDDIRDQLPSIRDKILGKDDSYKIQKAIQDLFLFDLQAQNAEYYAKRTIMGSYVPFTRRGDEQVRLTAKDASGNYVELHTSAREVLPYYQFEDRADALRAQEQLDETFGNGQKWVMPVDDGMGGISEKEVMLVPEVSRTRQSPDLTEAVNFNEFIYVLNRLNINLTPKVRERVVTTLTDQNSKARKNLQRSGTPGWDKDVVRSASEFLETSGHIAAKKRYRHRLDDIFLRQENWKGSDVLLQTLKRAVDQAQTPGEKAQAQRVYAQYAYMYKYMKATGKNNKVEIDGKMEPTLGRGEDYKEEAKAILRWYSNAGNISDTTEDLLSGEAGSRLKMGTVLMQLGGSVATAIVNFTSLLTHSLPYLSFYNAQQGYGGGYGNAKAATALFNAAKDIGNPKMSDDKFLAEMVSKGTYAEYGLTADEATFLLNSTEQGILQAAQFNALIGTARGKVGGNRTQKAIQLWMSMFSYTEQMNRRTTALAAYRLERDRALAEGKSELQAAFAAEEAARRAVNYSQGEYAMFNRPEMARGNVMQYVFMYKQFTIITIQMLKAMPLEGRMLMLGLLLLASGIRGLPFAEDIIDLVDTLCQMLGLKVGSVEKVAIDTIDAIAPGVSPYVMNGVINRALGATVSTRVGMGDIVPLTGALKAGASITREIENFAGPVVGALMGTVGTTYSLAKYGAETLGLKNDTTSLESIMRDSPMAAMRSLGDAYAYTTDGMVTNRKGQVVSSDASTMLIVTRLLGFYPNIATEQNDIVRLSKQIDAYAKEVKATYVQSYVKASLDKNYARMREIEGYVKEWNLDAEGTGLEINNFVPSAQRAAREAAKPTVARYMKSAPTNIKPETMEMLRAAGYDVAEL